MRQIFPLKDLFFGASKTSANTETALTPHDLREGALGIYGIDPATNKLVLVSNGTTSTGIVAAANFKGKQIVFGLGLASGADLSVPFDVANIEVEAKTFVAGTKKVINVGYTVNATTGSLNLPTISKNDEGSVIIKNMADVDGSFMLGKPYSGYAATDSAATYDILKDLADRVNGDEHRLVRLAIGLKGTFAEVHATTIGADFSVTNGSKTITFDVDPVVVAAGTILEIFGDVYKVASEESATSYTLDRAYTGATVSSYDISADTDSIRTITSITDGGFWTEDIAVGQATELSLDGIFADATKSVSTDVVFPVGTGTIVYQMEKDSRPGAFGTHDTTKRTTPLKDLEAVTTQSYDVWVISGTNTRHTSDPHNNQKSDNAVEIVIASPQGVNADDKNAHDMEDILTSLGVSFTAIANS